MAAELCPRCQTLRNLRVTTSREEVTDAHGNSKWIVSKTYHCEACNTFVRREETEDAERGR